MEDFVAEKGAAAPVAADQPSSARGLLVLSARRLAKGITAAVLPKKGYVKGVADRWDEAHLTPPPQYAKPYTGFTPVAPSSPELALNVKELPEWTPDRVGPLSFERRRTLIEKKIQDL